MTCYHPLKRFITGRNNDGTTEGIVTSFDTEYLVQRNGVFIPCETELASDRFLKKITEYQEIPCGHCIGCRLKYSSEWADRMLLELEYHESACFITLTYDDQHLPERKFVEWCDQDGEFKRSPYNSLVRTDLQKFFKRLRKRIEPKKIRYYACGEYGDKSGRPHYHAIIFGYDFPDKYRHGMSVEKFPYYRSDELEDLWQFGISTVCDVSWNTCAYVARYVTKKIKGLGSEVYEVFNYAPEFALMSRKPGIGRLYYDENKEKIYKNEEIILSTDKGAKKIRPPRYYDRLYDIDYPSDFQRIKEKRVEFAEFNRQLKSNLTSLSYKEQLIAAENNKLSQIKALRRSLE